MSVVETTPKTSSSQVTHYYCAGAIRGDISFLKYMQLIVKVVARYGEPYTERSESYLPLERYAKSSQPPPKKKIYERDIHWLRQSRAMIAEVSGASTGTGFEIREAIARRKPVLCLYHDSSLPSLMITQCPSEFVVVQQYQDEQQLESCLSCFMEIVSRLRHPEESPEVRRIYSLIQRGTDLTRLTLDEARRSAIELVSKLHAVKQPIDFNEHDPFLSFMIRNLVLLTRWDRLKSQRIGDTFVSGNLPRMIKALANSSIENQLINTLEQSAPATINFGKNYEDYRRQRTGYEHKAFIKNVKAFVRIGLLVYLKGRLDASRGSLDGEVNVVSALDGQRKLIPQKSRTGTVMKPTVALTKHAQELAAFLEKYNHKPLIRLLKEFRKSHPDQYQMLASLPQADGNIDFLKVNDIIVHDLGITRYLTMRSKVIRETKSV